jgi:hypothetical protein
MEVHQVYTWLFEHDNGFLGPTVGRFVAEMRKASKNGNPKITWSLVDCIPGLCDEYGVAREMAQARVECACVVYDLGNLRRASDLLIQAAGYYRPLVYHRGVTYCLLGIIYSEMRGGEEKALVAWRDSRRIFKNYHQYNRFLPNDQIDSCRRKRELISEAIGDVIESLNGG